MKLTLNTSSAVQAINYVMPACRKSTLPVLQNILLKPDGDKLKLTASTTEIELTATLDVQWSDQAAITVEGKKLADIFKSLPKNTDATITLDKDRLIVKQGRSRFTLKTLPAEDFPAFRASDDTVSIPVSGSELNDAMRQVSPSMATNDVRYYLNGIHFAPSQSGGIDVVATDGHRLSMCRITTPSENVTPFTVPTDAVKPVQALLGGDNVTLHVGNNSLCAANQGRTVTVKLVDGKYPDYNRVIPKNNHIDAEFNRYELIAAIGRVKLLSSESSKGIMLSINASGCVITGRNSSQEQAEDTIPCGLSGAESFEIGFNADYLIDALSSIDAESVVINFEDATTGATIKSGEFVGVVLPYRM